jgi:hypothetical protein
MSVADTQNNVEAHLKCILMGRAEDEAECLDRNINIWRHD